MEADTESEVVKESTKGVYYGKIFIYNLNTQNVPSNFAVGNQYNLKSALDQKAAPIWELPFMGNNTHLPANCFDVNYFLQISLSSLGIAAGVRETEARIELGEVEGQEALVYKPFVTNSFCPVGNDSTLSGLYVQVLFTKHLQVLTTGGISDSALSYFRDLSYAVYMNPAWSWSSSLAFEGWSATNKVGLAYREVVPTDAPYWHAALGINAINPDSAFGPANYDGEDTSLVYSVSTPFID